MESGSSKRAAAGGYHLNVFKVRISILEIKEIYCYKPFKLSFEGFFVCDKLRRPISLFPAEYQIKTRKGLPLLE